MSFLQGSVEEDKLGQKRKAPQGCLGRRVSWGAWWDGRVGGVTPGCATSGEVWTGAQRSTLPTGTHKPIEVILMSPEGTDLGIPHEEESRSPVLADQRPQ